jgi:PAS domain S-box-containing protein
MSKILIVDDRLLNRQLLVQLLSSHHHLACEASDGAEALQVARSERPDLVISDVLMPTMDGYEFVRQLRADPMIGQTPVIFITGNYLGREARSLAESCGVSSIIYRPCDKEEVLRSVNTALESARYPEKVLPLKREEFDREHLQLLTDTLSEKSNQLSAVNLKLTTLLEMSQQLASERDPLKLMNEYCRAAKEIIGTKWNALGVLSEDNQTLQHFHTIGLDDEIAKRLSPPSHVEGIFGKLLQDRRSYRIRITDGDPQAAGWPPDFPDLSSCLSLPIILQERVYGWICLANKLGADEFSDEDEQLAVTLVAQMAAAYENATLYSEARHRTAELEREIAEREQAEEALRDSEARYRLLFEKNPRPIWVYDSETLAFLAVNEAALHHYGYSREEFLAMTLKDLRPPVALPASLNQASQITGELTMAGVWKHRKKDGAVIDVELYSQPQIFAARRAEIVLVNDVTEHRRAREAMRAKNEELTAMTQQFWQASKLATMGELAASIAHELNNPLATVSLRTESLLGQFSDDDPKRRALKIIEQEVERMGNLVGNLLHFSRRNHPQTSVIDVYKEIENTLDFIEHYLRSRRINVVREFADTLPILHADRQQLRQVFLNLLMNASDAMTEGGTLTLRVSAGQTEHGAGAMVIEFADTGTGIKPEDLLKVWEPFFTTKGEGKGTGLGLAICRRIVEEHKGTINIESEVGKGTAVCITLPAPEREGYGTRNA